MKLSVTERLMLSNQYRILERLYPDEAESYARFQRILESGYEIHYNDLAPWGTEPPISRVEAKEALDILSMYQDMQHCFDNLADKSGIDADDIVFPGFDGNNDINKLSYTRYAVEECGRFSGLRYRDLDAHAPVTEPHERMLEEYHKHIGMTKDTILAILAERIHPDNR